MSLDRTEIEAATQPLNRARSMPAGFYTDPAIFAAERERVFLKHWFFLTRAEELQNPGDFRAFDSPGGPIVLIRGNDGQLRCFANYCRHRGSILLEGSGNVGGRITCPYHAWSYLNDGRLYGCPDMKDAEGFDKVENGLVALDLDQWEGFVFARFTKDGPTLLEHLGDFPARMASHKLGDMRCTWRITLDVACNWKLILENAVETYHTGIVHKNTVGAQQSRSPQTQGNWICIQVISGRSIATLTDEVPPFDPIMGLDENARQGTYFTVVMPTVQFAVAQDCLWWLNTIPVSENRTLLEVGGCFPESRLPLADFDWRAAPYYDRWERVAREDMGILEKQQRALGSALYRPGPLSWRDDMVQAMGVWVMDRLGL
ncbi:aromatic ring-hydroxylating dioxygenase subunit alpha [Tabrizicola sp.]|uniref:aromatic ring-hydroxylating oxygenase subunit alpha n=1 Tax=Tabrizicola sp. TaxID=2005166 RepID=UPI0026019F09|nr:aromatic ring-hydroxylating dioxygenase subunit alpha [Tabrizicola sp.]MDM7932882.1 aromatic ring-hydroxylating dioxygenase subunit alpha [Tabrizicola sp.]